jgi:subtilisin
MLKLTGTALASVATAGAASADHTHPVVTTDAPTNVTSWEATLNGTLDEMGDYNSSVDVYFRWGKYGTGFPNKTSTQTLTSPGSFSEYVSPLDSDTWYEYYAVAETDVTETGGIVRFTTEEGPSPEDTDS